MTDTPGTLVVRSYKYRVLPSKAQHAALAEILESQRVLYNAALEERISYYSKTGKSRSYMDQCKAVTQCRADMPEMAGLPVRLQRATLKRLDEAFAGFFRRIKTDGRVGFPRFRGRERFSSFGFAEFSGIQFDGKRVRFKGLPSGLRVRMTRPLPEGRPLSCSLKRDAKGWAIVFQMRVPIVVVPVTGAQCGIDLGLSSFATFDDGRNIPAPQVARRKEAEMRRRHRAMTRCKQGSNNRRKVKARLARLHQSITNARDTWLHQQSAKIVRENDLIAIEKLNVKGLASGMLARSVNDASWARFIFMLTYKAEGAGRKVIAVDPRNTTQACSGCGVIVPKDLSQRWHNCPDCGLSLNRDHNAARNILHRAVTGPGFHKLAVAPVGSGNLKELAN